MRLTELDPRFSSSGGEGIKDKDGNPVPKREGVGLLCDCPKCGGNHPLFVPFANPLDGGPSTHPDISSWKRTGDNFATMTLTPSIRRLDCGWHGFITDGNIIGA